MMNISGIRTAGLALVTVLGAAHLSNAEATPLTVDTCDDTADSYAEAFCRAMGHDEARSVTYSCTAGGQTQIISVTCGDGPEEPEEMIG